MIGYISAEWRKLHKMQLLGIGILLLSISSFIGLSTYFLNRSVFVEGTQTWVMWGQLTLLNSQIFYPALLAIFMGISMMPEFERTTLEMLRVNQVSLSKLAISKILTVLFVTVPLQLLLVLIWSVALSFEQIQVIPEIAVHLKWVFLSLIGSISIMMVQAFILSKTRNFAKSVAFSAIGSIGGFLLLFVGEGLSRFYPYSQIMIALRSRALTDMSWMELLIFVLINAIYSILFFGLTVRELRK